MKRNTGLKWVNNISAENSKEASLNSFQLSIAFNIETSQKEKKKKETLYHS